MLSIIKSTEDASLPPDGSSHVNTTWRSWSSHHHHVVLLLANTWLTYQPTPLAHQKSPVSLWSTKCLSTRYAVIEYSIWEVEWLTDANKELSTMNAIVHALMSFCSNSELLFWQVKMATPRHVPLAACMIAVSYSPAHECCCSGASCISVLNNNNVALCCLSNVECHTRFETHISETNVL